MLQANLIKSTKTLLYVSTKRLIQFLQGFIKALKASRNTQTFPSHAAT